MALFKSEEDKHLFEKKLLNERQERIKKYENEILKERVFKGKIGSTHTGWNFRDGLRNADKAKFKKTKFQIFDDKLIIERNRNVVQFSDVKEIFNEERFEVIIILNNGNALPIKKNHEEKLEAFINVLNKLIEENKSNINTNESNTNTNTHSEDKFDKLIKLGEMHKNGLLSDEEFASLKQELLAGNNEDTTPESDDEPSNTTCENCGTEVSSDDAFCSECGTKIN